MILRPAAEADLAEARAWYASRREGLAEDFDLCVEETLDRIGRMPLVPLELYHGVRRSMVRRFPYAVHYLAEIDRVVVVAVTHNRRNPNRWRGRV